MLAHVGGVDAHIDSAEWTSLIDAVLAASGQDDDLVAAVMGELAAALHRGERQIPDGHEPLEGLTEIRSILAGWHDDSGEGYRVALMEIGAAIADASGAQLTIRYGMHHGNNRWAPSPATSPAERRALEGAAVALGLAVPADQGQQSAAER